MQQICRPITKLGVRMNRVFTAWGVEGHGGIATRLVEGEGPPESPDGHTHLLWRVEVGSFEEAQAVRNLRNGWEPFTPEGGPAACPECGALHYPTASGQCWRCEHVS